MASVFAISPATDKLKAETGSATAVYTVTNSTSRTLRGFAKIRPLGNTQAQWLTIAGEAERDFPAGGTHQFTVAFNKPKPATPPKTPQPAESFPFRLDVISAVNPGEDFTEGPVVTVEIPEQKGGGGGVRWWMIAVGAAVLLIVGGVVAFLLSRNGGGNVEVPDVTNQTFAEANTRLQNVSLTAVRVDVNDANKEPDKIFAQDPAAGAKVAANTNVSLSIPATTTVPRVVGLSINDARALLEQRGLVMSNPIRSKDVSDAIPEGTIGFQFPTANKPALKGSEVTVFIPCRGFKCLLITDVIGGRMSTADKKVVDDLKQGK